MPTESTPTTEDVICPNCRTANPAGNRFCGQCGRSLPAPAEESAGAEAPVAEAAEQPAAEAARPTEPVVRAAPVVAAPLVTAAQEVGDVVVPEDPIAKERERDRLLSLASVQRMRAQIVDARKTLQQALIVSAGLPGAQIAPIHEMIGDLMAAEERWDQAADAYEKAHQLDPKRMTAEKKYGEMTLRLADEKAMASLGDAFLKGDGSALSSGARGKRSPGFAMILSLIMPGFGQFYNGQFVKGSICLGIVVLAIFLIAVTSDLNALLCLFAPTRACRGVHVSPLTWLCLAIFVAVWLYGLVDAPMSAARTTDDGVGLSGGPAIDKSGWEV